MGRDEGNRGSTTGEPSASSMPPWNWHSQLPIQNSPVFAWPPRLWAASLFLLQSAFLTVDQLIFLAFALVTWWLLRDGLSSAVSVTLSWTAQVYSLNVLMMVLVAGGLHLYFYRFAKQAKCLKFTYAGLESHHLRYLFSNQTWDNITWSLVSGVTVWTCVRTPGDVGLLQRDGIDAQCSRTSCLVHC